MFEYTVAKSMDELCKDLFPQLGRGAGDQKLPLSSSRIKKASPAVSLTGSLVHGVRRNSWAFFGPCVSETILRDNRPKMRICQYINPGCRCYLFMRFCNHIFASISVESPQSIEKTKSFRGMIASSGKRVLDLRIGFISGNSMSARLR